MSSYYSFVAIQIRSNITGLKSYLKNATGENSEKIHEVIKLYERAENNKYKNRIKYRRSISI